jgi:hypothetical protein
MWWWRAIRLGCLEGRTGGASRSLCGRRRVEGVVAPPGEACRAIIRVGGRGHSARAEISKQHIGDRCRTNGEDDCL